MNQAHFKELIRQIDFNQRDFKVEINERITEIERSLLEMPNRIDAAVEDIKYMKEHI